MSLHPTNERLSEFAWDALEGAEADSVERHVAECALCALRVERVRAEARRISAALETQVPAGLSARILDAATPAAPSAGGGFRFAPWLGVAAAALFATAAAWAMHERSDALRKLDQAHKDLAARPVTPPETVPVNDDMDIVRRQMALFQLEGRVDDVMAGVNVEPESRELVREILLASLESSRDVLSRAGRGEIDFDALQTTDALAGMAAEMQAKLDPSVLRESIACLRRRSHADAVAEAKNLVGDLQVAASLDQTQSSALESLIVDKTGWRLDFHFLPESVQRELVSRVLGFGGKLTPQSEALLNAEQKSRVLNYLGSSETERKRYWENLRKTQ